MLLAGRCVYPAVGKSGTQGSTIYPLPPKTLRLLRDAIIRTTISSSLLLLDDVRALSSATTSTIIILLYDLL